MRQGVADRAGRVSGLRCDQSLIRKGAPVKRLAVDGRDALDLWQVRVVRAKGGKPFRRSVQTDDLDLNDASAAAR